MTNWTRIEAIKELTVHSYGQAKAYTNVILVAGYAGLLTFWTTSKDNLSVKTALFSGLLIALSLMIFILWEILGMISRSKSFVDLNRALNDPDRFEILISNHEVAERNRNKSLMALWSYFLIPTLLFGFGAITILVSAFVHGLYIQYGPSLFVGEALTMSQFISLFFGALLAVVCGLIFQTMSEKRKRSRYNQTFAAAVTDDLKSSAEIFSEIELAWKEAKYINFALIDEIAASRQFYDGDRLSLFQMQNAELRKRVARYYRKSAATLTTLRREQQNFYGIKESEVKAADQSKFDSQVNFHLDVLSGLRFEALDLAEKTENWS